MALQGYQYPDHSIGSNLDHMLLICRCDRLLVDSLVITAPNPMCGIQLHSRYRSKVPPPTLEPGLQMMLETSLACLNRVAAIHVMAQNVDAFPYRLLQSLS